MQNKNEENHENNESMDISVGKEELMDFGGQGNRTIQQENNIRDKQQESDNQSESGDYHIYYEGIKGQQIEDIFNKNNYAQQEEKKQQIKNNWTKNPSNNRFGIKSKSEDNFNNSNNPFNIQDIIQEEKSQKQLQPDFEEDENQQDQQILVRDLIDSKNLSSNEKNSINEILNVLIKLDEQMNSEIFFYTKCLSQEDDKLNDNQLINKIVQNIKKQTDIFKPILDRIKLDFKNKDDQQNSKEKYQQKIQELQKYLSTPSNDFFFIQFDNLTKEFQNNEIKMKEYINDKEKAQMKINQIKKELEFEQIQQTRQQINFQQFKEDILKKNLFVFHDDKVMLLEMYKLINQIQIQLQKILQNNELKKIEKNLYPLNKQIEEIMLNKFQEDLNQEYQPNLVDSFLYKIELNDFKKTNSELLQQNKKLQNQIDTLKDQLKNDILREKKSNEQLQKKIDNLEQDVIKEQEDNQKNLQQLKTFQDTSVFLYDKIDKLNQQLQIINKETENINLQNNLMQNDSQNKSNKEDEIQKLRELNKRLMLKSQQNQDQFDNDIIRYRNMEKDLENKLVQIQEKNSFLEEQIKSYNDNNRSFSNFLKISEDDFIDDQNQNKSKLNEQKIYLEKINQKLLTENQLLQDNIRRLDCQVEEYRQKLNETFQKLEQIKNKSKGDNKYRPLQSQIVLQQQLKNQYKLLLQEKNKWQKISLVVLIAFLLYVFVPMRYTLK